MLASLAAVLIALPAFGTATVSKFAHVDVYSGRTELVRIVPRNVGADVGSDDVSARGDCTTAQARAVKRAGLAPVYGFVRPGIAGHRHGQDPALLAVYDTCGQWVQNETGKRLELNVAN